MTKVWNNPITDNTDWGGDSSTNYLPVSGEQVQAWLKAKLSGIKSDEDIEAFIEDWLEEKGLAADGGFVTLKTEQTVEGAKNFTGGLKVNGAPVQYNAEKDAWVFNGNLIVTGGAAFGSTLNQADVISVFENIPIDGSTIYWYEDANGNKVLKAKGGSSGDGTGSGLDEDQLAQYLEEYRYATKDWITEQAYATQAWVEEKKYLTEASLEETFVTIDTEQTIKAVKNFEAGIKVGGMPITYDADVDAWVFNGNLLVTGGAAFHSSLTGFDVNGVMDAIKYNKDTLRINENGELEVIGGTSGDDSEGGISEVTAEMIIEALGYTPYDEASFTTASIKSTLGIYDWALASTKPSYSYSEITGTPTSLKNPYSLTFTGYDTGTYNGSSALSIEIPEELPSPYSLSWSGYSSGSYDGSGAKSISIPSRLGQLTDDILDGYYLPIDGTAEAAEKLATSRKIWGKAFDGSADVDGALTITTSEGSLAISGPGSYDQTFSIDSTTIMGFSVSNKSVFVNKHLYVGGQSSGSSVATFYVKGNGYISGQFAHALSSDIRLKQNVRKFKVSEYLSTLGGAFLFEYIDEEVERDAYYAGTHLGFIYQNIKESKLKGMCIEREDGYGALNYFHSDYLGLLGAAAIEHEDRITTVERQIAALQAELKQLKSA